MGLPGVGEQVVFFEFEEGEEGVASDPADDPEAFDVAIPLRELYESLDNALHVHLLQQQAQLEATIALVLEYPSLIDVPH